MRCILTKNYWKIAKEVVIVLFCLGMVLTTFLWNLPSNYLSNSVGKYTREFMYPLGLSQAWAMFYSKKDAVYSTRIDRVYGNGEVIEEIVRFRQVKFWRTAENKMYDYAQVTREPYGSSISGYYCRAYQDASSSLKRVIIYQARFPTPSLGNANDASDPYQLPTDYKPVYDRICAL